MSCVDVLTLPNLHRVQVAYTPIVGMFLNWPPVLRSLLASMWMFGIMPPYVKDYQAMLRPVVEQFAQYAPGPTGEDLRVWDADTETNRDLRVVNATACNDVRGLPCGTCGANPPAYVGSCNFCKQTGRRVHARTVLGGAVRAVGMGTIQRTTCVFVLPHTRNARRAFLSSRIHETHDVCFCLAAHKKRTTCVVVITHT
jgi:hypothetical protein